MAYLKKKKNKEEEEEEENKKKKKKIYISARKSPHPKDQKFFVKILLICASENLITRVPCIPIFEPDFSLVNCYWEF